MIRLPEQSINAKSPYNVTIREDGSAYFLTDAGIRYIVYFDADDTSMPSFVCYQLVIVNVDNKPSPRDRKLRDTIVAIVEGFFQINNEVMLYVCETGDGKQAMRARLFTYWFEHYSYKKNFSFLSGCVPDENGVDNYASLILRTDHPQYAAVVSEFGNTIQVLNNKPKD